MTAFLISYTNFAEDLQVQTFATFKDASAYSIDTTAPHRTGVIGILQIGPVALFAGSHQALQSVAHITEAGRQAGSAKCRGRIGRETAGTWIISSRS